MKKTATIASAALILYLSGCGGKGRPGEEYIVSGRSKGFETVWVDPQLILADSLVTLIKAGRIDSITVDPSAAPNSRPSAIEIPVIDVECNVSVSLLDAEKQYLRPLMVQQLRAGYYKMTLNTDRLQIPALVAGNYFLRADACRFIILAKFTVD